MEIWNVLYKLLFILVIMTEDIDTRFCNESRNTMTVTKSCPTSEAEVKERARDKGCDSLTRHQNCSDPSKFKYHCVINAEETELVEVCAPVYFILGYCAEYNDVGARIQDHYNRRCTEFSPSCPSRYISTDAYRFSGCYEWVTRHRNSTPEITTPFTNDNSKSDVDIHMTVGIVAGLVSLSCIGFATIYSIRRKKDDYEIMLHLEGDLWSPIHFGHENYDTVDYIL